MTSFQKEQRASIYLASAQITGHVYSENELNMVRAVVGELLYIISNHPSLMDSTFEADEVLQNAVNDLVAAINKKAVGV